MTAKNIALITGESGFTGPYLRKALESQGLQTIGLVETTPNAQQIAADITDRQQLTNVIADIKPAYVIHLAGISHVQHGNPIDFYRVNVLGTENVLHALKETNCNPRKIIIVSSANVYGDCTESPITENAPIAPVNHYGISKASVEYLSRTWFETFPIIITRAFNYTGVGQSENFVIPKLVEHFAKRKSEIQLGRTDVVRSYTDVRAVADIYTKLLLSPLHNDVINICSNQCFSLDKILQILTELTQHTLSIKQNPKFIRANEIQLLTGSPKKLRDVIGDLPEYPFNDTLQWMLSAYSS